MILELSLVNLTCELASVGFLIFISSSPSIFPCRDFQKIDEILVAPIIEALQPVANISVESQVIYFYLSGI